MRNKIFNETQYLLLDEEEYMSPAQLAYFKHKLEHWKFSLQQEFAAAVSLLQEKNWSEPDIADRASDEADLSLELRTQGRYRKLMDKINDALMRIEKGVYGFCEETNEPIGLKRLEARPIATLSITAQERHERFEKTHNEDE